MLRKSTGSFLNEPLTPKSADDQRIRLTSSGEPSLHGSSRTAKFSLRDDPDAMLSRPLRKSVSNSISQRHEGCRPRAPPRSSPLTTHTPLQFTDSLSLLAAANTFDNDIADIAAATSAAAPGPFLRNKRTIATVAFIVFALLASFLLFYFVYPLYNPRNTTTVQPPPPLNGSLCRNPDARGCFDYALCIAPGYNRSDLKKPDCLPDPSPCS